VGGVGVVGDPPGTPVGLTGGLTAQLPLHPIGKKRKSFQSLVTKGIVID